jgi:hypothetical protein
MPPQIETPRKHTGLIWLVVAIILVGALAGGYFWYRTSNTNFPFTNTTDQSSNLKTYTNGEYGYQFEYPSNWSAATNEYNKSGALFGVGATSQSGTGGVELMGELKTGQSLKNFISEFNKGVESGSLSETESTINEQRVIISIMPHAGMPPTETKSVAFSNNGKVFNVYIRYHSETTKYPEDKTNLTAFDHLLSTFKFIK